MSAPGPAPLPGRPLPGRDVPAAPAGERSPVRSPHRSRSRSTASCAIRSSSAGHPERNAAGTRGRACGRARRTCGPPAAGRSLRGCSCLAENPWIAPLVCRLTWGNVDRSRCDPLRHAVARGRIAAGDRRGGRSRHLHHGVVQAPPLTCGVATKQVADLRVWSFHRLSGSCWFMQLILPTRSPAAVILPRFSPGSSTTMAGIEVREPPLLLARSVIAVIRKAGRR